VSKKKAFSTYEEVADYLLNEIAVELGVDRIEGRQTVPGHISGTWWEIDGKGVREEDGAIVIVECRRYTTSRQCQDRIGGLAWRIRDTGAIGGIMVSPMGLQKGAKLVAKAASIVNVELTADSTPTDFVMKLLDRWKVGLSGTVAMSGSLQAVLKRHCAKCGQLFTVAGDERICPSCR